MTHVAGVVVEFSTERQAIELIWRWHWRSGIVVPRGFVVVARRKLSAWWLERSWWDGTVVLRWLFVITRRFESAWKLWRWRTRGNGTVIPRWIFFKRTAWLLADERQPFERRIGLVGSYGWQFPGRPQQTTRKRPKSIRILSERVV